MKKFTTILAIFATITLAQASNITPNNTLEQPSKLCLTKMEQAEADLFNIAQASKEEDLEILDVLVPYFLENSKVAMQNCPQKYTVELQRVRNNVKSEYIKLQKLN